MPLGLENNQLGEVQSWLRVLRESKVYRDTLDAMNRALAAASIPLAAVFLSACTININVPSNPGVGMMDSEHGGADEVEMFAEMMIPHHQQAIDMSELALERSSNPHIRDLSQRIIDGQTPEIELMSEWLPEGQRNSDMARMRISGMGGMASEAEMAELETLEGEDFDRLFLSLMITHHEGALHMVHMIDDSNSDEVSQLARDITRVQTQEIDEMTRLFGELTDA